MKLAPLAYVALSTFCVEERLLSQTPLTVARAYASYFGGSGDDYAQHVSFDGQGNIIIAGSTTSNDLPGTNGAFQSARARGIADHRDVFIAKFNASATALLWVTYLGGSQNETVNSLVVDSAGDIVVAGETSSTDFPVSSTGWQQTLPPNTAACFVSKVSGDGRTLIGSTYLREMQTASVAIDRSGDVAVATVGSANPNTLVTTGSVTAPSPTFSSIASVFLFRFNNSLARLVFCAHLGGGSFEGQRSARLVIDYQSNFVISGATGPGRMPIPPTALQSSYPNTGLGGLPSGYILKVSPLGDRVVAGTYFGPRFAAIQPTSVKVDTRGAVWLTGISNAEDLPVTVDAIRKTKGPAFVGRVSGDLSRIEYLSYQPTDSGPQTVEIEPESAVLHILQGQIYTRADLRSGSTLVTQLPLVGAAIVARNSRELWVLSRNGDATPGSAFDLRPGREDVVLTSIRLVEQGIAAIVSAASPEAGTSCGQLVSLFGAEMGPAVGVAASVEGGQLPTSLAGTRVLVGPNATPAPLLYVRADQVNAAIPFSLCGQTTADLVLERNGARISTTKLTLEPTAPALFTTGGGRGQIAALNQDGSVNGPSTPARRGQAIILFLTGAGAMTGPVVDGGLAIDAGVRVASPTSVLLGGSRAGEVLYSGAAPGLVFGVAQINVLIPTDAPVGTAIAISVRIGGIPSPAGTTLSIQ